MIDAARLHDHLERLAESDVDLPARFYETMFGRHPEVKPLFGRNSAEAQQKMMGELIQTVVEHAEDLEAIAPDLRALGVQHQDYGPITPAMYDVVATCMIDTLRAQSGEHWDDALEDAWRSVFAYVNDVMMRAHFGETPS